MSLRVVDNNFAILFDEYPVKFVLNLGHVSHCPVGCFACCVPVCWLTIVDIISSVFFRNFVHHPHTRWDGAQRAVDSRTKEETGKMVV